MANLDKRKRSKKLEHTLVLTGTCVTLAGGCLDASSIACLQKTKIGSFIVDFRQAFNKIIVLIIFIPH